jgi:integrase
VDTPKTQKSIRTVPLAVTVQEDLKNWLAISPVGAEAWLFPSEKLDTPLSKDNAVYRHMRPRLKKVKLEWVDFHVMRRTHASLMHASGSESGSGPYGT